MLKTNKTEKFPTYKLPYSHLCIICGNANCSESTDHVYVNFTEFKELAMKARCMQPEIELIKGKVMDFYKDLLKRIKEELEEECLSARERINRFYYHHHLSELNGQQLRILSQAIENDMRSLPTKNIYACTVYLKETFNQPRVHMPGDHLLREFTQKCELIQQEIENFSFTQLRNQIKMYTVKLEEALDGKEQNIASLTRVPNRASSRFSELTTHPESLIFQWKNLKIRSNFKTLTLSCKKISDADILQNLPKIQKFPNIIELDARLNGLSYLSCICVKNFLPQLVTLDIRSNNVGDVGMGKLKGMVHLKQLMVDQNGITDVGVGFVMEGFQALEVLWADHNRISQKGALLLGQKDMLKICSLINNQIDSSFGSQIKSLFARKGLIYI